MRVKHIQSSGMLLNTYIVVDEAKKVAAVIDPGYDNDELFSYLKTADVQVKYIVATHGHFDHVLLVERLQKEFGGEILIHEADEEMLRTDTTGFLRRMGITPPVVKANQMLQGGESISLGDLSLKIYHTPGHTKGSICIACGDCLFTGDTLFHDDVGRTDLPGGSPEELRHSIAEVLGGIAEDLRVLPGHEEASTLAYEKANNPFFQKMQ